MNRLISTSSAFLYKTTLKPILFRFKPDHVHSMAIKAGGMMQHSKLALSMIRSSFSFTDEQTLGQRKGDIYFKNPIGLSAGFDKNAEIPLTAAALGFGFAEIGTITDQPYKGNLRPWFHRLPHSQALVVHAGLANQGTKMIIERLKRYPAKTFQSFPLSISVAQTNTQKRASEREMIRSYERTLRALKREHLGQMITLNISCPNTFNGEPFTTPSALNRLLDEVDGINLKQPVFLKMPCDLGWRHYRALLEVAKRHKVAGVILTNLTKDRSRISNKDTLPITIRGGLSGKLTTERSNHLLKKTYEAYGDRFTIIGVGGVFTARDAYRKIRLGASLVQMITGLIFEGPQVVGKINADLAALLRADGFYSISEAVGVDTVRGVK